MKEVKLAYSPDTDDAFMVQAMRRGYVNTDAYAFDYTKADIQKLNEEAEKGTYDITAISIAAYPSIADDYYMMPVGASIGDEYGPAIVTPKESPVTDVNDLKGKKVVVPGLQTSAYFALVAIIGDFEAIPCYFADIEEKVKSGDADAGILIHETQLANVDSALTKIADLGRLWYDTFHLPLPLGANAIKKDLGKEHIKKLTRIYRDSIQYGLDHRNEILKETVNLAMVPLEQHLADDYISRYVNHRSLRMDDDVKKAIAVMYEEGHKHGLCGALKAEDYLWEEV